MGRVNVKNTMVERALQIIAPHLCYGCGKIGTILCDCCANNIIDEPFMGCVLCGAPCASGVCSQHANTPYSQAFVVGLREGVLEDIIDSLKFNRVKDSSKYLAELLNTRLPLLPTETLVTAVPTLPAHIRKRGYDQVALIARHFASLRGLKLITPIKHIGKGVQHESSRIERATQASEAFEVKSGFDLSGKTVLLIDDIITTGATIGAVSQALKNIGATVMVAAVAYQPLD